MIRKERIYNSPIVEGEYRILVDRLWPRGVSKEKAHLDVWMKELGPSTVLRRWFNHDPSRYNEFKTKYLLELDIPLQKSLLNEIIAQSKQSQVVLLFASHEENYNQVTVLLEVLETMAHGD